MKNAIRFSVLASGSSGNACYVETDNARILVDAGLSCSEIERRLELIGVQPENLDALIITHEHGDHIRGAGPLSRRYDLPVYINRKTFKKGLKMLGNLARPVIFQTGQSLAIRDLGVETFTKCHDASDPFGLVFTALGGSSTSNGTRIGLVTDLGRSTRLVEDRLKGCHALIIEFNYDQEMLDNGPYPLDLQRRIKGQDGHLSNEQAGDLLRAVAHDDLRVVVLAHLSETNNEPDKACQEAEKALAKCGLDNTRLLISKQDETGPMVEL
jgi:phosphoribosyl 1,2-cyclic phosphodiesterase